jgi:hypothetical protein
MSGKRPGPRRAAFARPFVPIALFAAASLLLLGAGCAGMRQGCHGCAVANPIPDSCPFRETKLAGGLASPTLLVLSGGAAYGAWGAGVLHGWPSPRPKFTVVTGVSTGALQATFAFLGRKGVGESDRSYDEKLRVLFTEVESSDIYTTKWYWMLSNSLQAREPLRQLIDDNLTDALIDEVAGVADRELWVGTVNLDTSEFCPWNLSEVARRGKGASDPSTHACYQQLFRDVIFAASGAPVIAPPVPIDAKACTGAPPEIAYHVDGGVRLRVFAEGVVMKLVQPVAASPPSQAQLPEPLVYAIMNGQLATRPQCVPDHIALIGARALEIMDHESLFGGLYALAYRFADAGKPWKLRLSRIPDATCLDFESREFVPEKLRALFDAGSHWVQASDPWETRIPDASAANWPPGCCSKLLECPANAPQCPDDCPL